MKEAPPQMLRSMAEEDMTAEAALAVGQAVGKSYRAVCVGSDADPGSGMVKAALVGGLLSA
ncbi:MAG: hypothetical protein FWH47_04455, partial [Methanomassiliicoccaceae archaeon]|nr:hypothetical protein [Methanomassiliicoccaceae archaeon]